MKNIAISIILAGVITPAFAGKNVVPATSVPVPVPVVNYPQGIYIGLGGNGSFFTRICPCSRANNPIYIHDNNYGFTGRLGYDFNQFLGGEIRLFASPLDSNFLKHYFGGLYLKPKYPLTKKLTVYGLLGYGRNKLKFHCLDGTKYTKNVNAPSVGIGFEYFFNEKNHEGKRKGLSVWADIVNVMYKKSEAKFKSNVFSMGLNYHF